MELKPATPPTVVMAFNIDAEQLKWIDELAAKRDPKLANGRRGFRSQIMREILAAAMARSTREPVTQ